MITATIIIVSILTVLALTITTVLEAVGWFIPILIIILILVLIFRKK